MWVLYKRVWFLLLRRGSRLAVHQCYFDVDFILRANAAVTTNPPWVKINELPRRGAGLVIRDYIKRNIVDRYKREIPGISRAVWRGDLSLLFIDLLLEIMKKGYIGAVVPANQTYSGYITSHGAGKMLTLAIIRRRELEGEILYVGDIFRHGVPASIAILYKR